MIQITKKATKTLEKIKVMAMAAEAAMLEAGESTVVMSKERPALKKLTAAWMAQHDLNEGKQVQGQLRRVEILYAKVHAHHTLTHTTHPHTTH